MTAKDYPVSFRYGATDGVLLAPTIFSYFSYRLWAVFLTLIPRSHALFKLRPRRKSLTLEHYLLTFSNIWMGKFSMKSMCIIQFKIVWVITSNILVNVMNRFVFIKDASYFLLHHDTMLRYISLFTSIGVIWSMQIPVSSSLNTTFIEPRFLAFEELSLKVSRYIHILSVNSRVGAVK